MKGNALYPHAKETYARPIHGQEELQRNKPVEETHLHTTTTTIQNVREHCIYMFSINDLTI
jgi:hypothetical protein